MLSQVLTLGARFLVTQPVRSSGQPEGVAVRTGSDVWIGGYSLAAMR